MPLAFFKRRKISTKRSKSTSCLNVSKLLIAGLPTIVFGLFTVIFTIQQDASGRATREQDQRQADEINRRTIFKEYIDDMKEMLLDEHLGQNMNRSLRHIRIQTLTVLKHVDPDRKRDVILFLYENHLLQHDVLPNIDLHGADLTGVRFVQSTTELCALPNLDLRGVYAENIVFDNCQLIGAIFDDAVMVGAQFQSCSLVNSSYFHTNLNGALFHGNHLYGANLDSASLIRSSIRGGVFQGVSLINTDLYGSDISEELLYPVVFGGFSGNIFQNTRFPNGTFVEIDTSELKSLDGLSLQCLVNSTFVWHDTFMNSAVRTINTTQISGIDLSQSGSECLFQLDKQKVAGQFINVRHFSLMINLEQAMFNVSLFAGGINADEKDDVMISVGFIEDAGSYEYSRAAKKTIQNLSQFQFHSFTDFIPPKTRYMMIAISCNMTGADDQFCLFDQFKMFVFQKPHPI